MISIANAQRIEGNMEAGELSWLASQAVRSVRIVEVGCWKGRSTCVLAEHTVGKVYAVDTWLGSEEHQESLRDKPPGWLYSEFHKNVRDFVDTGKIVPVPTPSVDAAKYFTLLGRRFDFVFIDASHDYPSVRADILAWRPLVDAGGILAGHDRNYPPVEQATNKLLGEVKSAGDIWWVRI